jgi:hypothetical protein
MHIERLEDGIDVIQAPAGAGSSSAQICSANTLIDLPLWDALAGVVSGLDQRNHLPRNDPSRIAVAQHPDTRFRGPNRVILRL